jgi:hypothetical protein
MTMIMFMSFVFVMFLVVMMMMTMMMFVLFFGGVVVIFARGTCFCLIRTLVSSLISENRT